jgi:hypothetical protein
MGFLRRLVGGAEPPPDWSPFDDGRTHQAFIDAVEADLRRRGVPFEMGDGVVLVPPEGDEQGEPTQLGLSNLSQQCAGADREEWPAMIATHFSAMRSILGRDIDALAADYEQARRVLAVRLMPDESTGGTVLHETAVRTVAPGILAVLVFDFPDSTATLSLEHLQGWPVDLDGAIELGLGILDREPQPIRDDVHEEDVRFTVWYGDSFYVATWAMRLAALLPPGTTDALVAVPNRHTLAVHPIVDADAVSSLQAIYRLAIELYRDGPGSISDQAYWWHDGELTVIPHHTKGRDVTVVPPDGLLAVFETVIARAEGG